MGRESSSRKTVGSVSEGQLSDHVGAKLIYPAIPNAKVLIGDKGYDSDEFRDALKARKSKPASHRDQTEPR
jgi:hypothetical protein